MDVNDAQPVFVFSVDRIHMATSAPEDLTAGVVDGFTQGGPALESAEFVAYDSDDVPLFSGPILSSAADPSRRLHEHYAQWGVERIVVYPDGERPRFSCCRPSLVRTTTQETWLIDHGTPLNGPEGWCTRLLDGDEVVLFRATASHVAYPEAEPYERRPAGAADLAHFAQPPAPPIGFDEVMASRMNMLH